MIYSGKLPLRPTFMKVVQTIALIFMIMGLIGVISETGPVWARYTILSLGIVFLVVAIIKNQKTNQPK
jgi:hypothetical protein